MLGKNPKNKIAYLSLEIALDEQLATYAGGLGILAGDFLRSAADLDLPLVGISLLNKQGYFNQKIDRSGRQIAQPEKNSLKKLKRLTLKVKVAIGHDQVTVGAWKYLVNNKLPVYLLDTDLPENKTKYRHLTDCLYGKNQRYRLKQEIILGRGGVKILRALGYQIKKFHINEGHGILAALELLANLKGEKEARLRKKLRRQLVFTNHTPVRAGQDIFPLSTMLNYQPDFPIDFKDFVVEQKVNLTRLGVILAGRTNGVSKKHRQTLQQEFPSARIDYVTNGVHAAFWSSPEFAKLYDKYLPGWRDHNAWFKKAKKIPLLEIAQAHEIAKKRLISYVFKKTGITLDPESLTLVFARRFTAYKQPLLLLSDIRRLLKLNFRWPLQIIYAGKAHPQDNEGQEMIKKIYWFQEKYQKKIKIVFLENYDLALARRLMAGADLWLNNPQAPKEACGTSGMKASLNGVPQLSSLDGWWREAYRKNKNGWAIKDGRADELYKILETKILPLYYRKSKKWSKLMRNTIRYNAPVYNSERMVKEYWRKIY